MSIDFWLPSKGLTPKPWLTVSILQEVSEIASSFPSFYEKVAPFRIVCLRLKCLLLMGLSVFWGVFFDSGEAVFSWKLSRTASLLVTLGRVFVD